MDRNKVLELATKVWGASGGTVYIGPPMNQVSEFADLVEREVRGDAEPVAYETDTELWAADAPDINNWIRKNGRPLYRHPAPAVVRRLVDAVDRLRQQAKWINDEQAIVGYEEMMELKAALAAANGGSNG